MSLAKIRDFEARLRTLPTVVAQKVAARGAEVITELAQSTFNAGEDAYGVPWTPGAEGQRVTLRKTGGLAGGIKYVAIGTRLRAVLGVAWAKYQVGKRPVFPRGGATLPAAYSARLKQITADECRAWLAGGAS